MNMPSTKSATRYSPKLCDTIWMGWHDILHDLPPRELSCARKAFNYENARLLALEFKRIHGYLLSWPPGLIPAWLRGFMLEQRQRAFERDEVEATRLHGAKRPPHLIKADLAAELQAANLASLAPPVEEVY